MLEIKRCPICDNLFDAKRLDARYCSSKCRQRAGRSKVRASTAEQTYLKQAQQAVNMLFRLSQFRKLRSLLLEIVSSLPDEERARFYEAIEEDRHRLKYELSVTKSVTDKK